MATTPIYGLRYPVQGDAPSVPQHIEQLARDAEDALAARTYLRFTGQQERVSDGSTLLLPADVEVSVRQITTTIMNGQAVIHAYWYGFTLSGLEDTKVLVRIRRTDINGQTMSAWWSPKIEPTADSGVIGGGTTVAFDPSPGVNPSYVLTMQRAPASVGTLRLNPGATSPYGAIIAEQKGLVQ